MHIKNRILVNGSIHPKLRFYRFSYKVRDRIYNFYKKKLPNLIHRTVNENEKDIINNLNKSGFSFFNSLSNEDVIKARSQISELNFDIGQEGKVVYSHSELFKKGILNKIYLNEGLLKVIQEYFGCSAKIQYLSAWKTIPGIETNEMFFHPDRHGHKFLKFFIYLNDVNEFDGHHEIIPGSQENNLDKILKNESDDLLRAMKLKIKKGWYKKIKLENKIFNDSNIKIKKVFGKSGTTFIEDTSCFHRGTPVSKKSNERIIFQVLYTPWDNQKDYIQKIIKPEWVKKFNNSRSAQYAISNLLI
tara:strand:- start:95 stop:1000 length:906 start_codon:yes stop_codon:yes gene_type:complete